MINGYNVHSSKLHAFRAIRLCMQGTTFYSSSSHSTGSGDSSSAAVQSSLEASQTQPDFNTHKGNAFSLPVGVHQESCKLAGKTWTFETGRLARLAHGSCLVTVGGTSVLSTAVVDPNPQPEADGVPLQVGGGLAALAVHGFVSSMDSARQQRCEGHTAVPAGVHSSSEQQARLHTRNVT
jgi:hypothetical protein